MNKSFQFPKEIPAWQRDRAIAFHDTCALLQKHISKGEAVVKAAAKIARRLNGKMLDGGKKPLRISGKTLLKVYYLWLKSPCPASLVLRYKPGKGPIEKGLTLEFIRLALRFGSLKKAYESLVQDWKSAKPIRGLGTWRTWIKKHAPEMIGATIPPRFPASFRTFLRNVPVGSIQAIQFLRAQTRQSEKAVRQMERQILEQKGK